MRIVLPVRCFVRVRPAVTALVLAAGLCPPAAAQDPAGLWVGSYVCAQGVTALDLSLTADDSGGVAGVFHFGALPPHPAVPEGCFRMAGRLDPLGRTLTLAPVAWLLHPTGFVMVGLRGRFGPDGATLVGTVQGPGCTTFAVRRVSALAPRDPACAPQVASVAAPAD